MYAFVRNVNVPYVNVNIVVNFSIPTETAKTLLRITYIPFSAVCTVFALDICEMFYANKASD